MSALSTQLLGPFLIALGAAGCSPKSSLPAGGAGSEPDAEKIALEWQSLGKRVARSNAAPLFERLESASSGVGLSNDFDWEHPNRHLYEHGFAGGGVAIGDVDGDGLPDLYLTSQTGRDALYRQVGPLEFEDVSEQAGLDSSVQWGAGAAFGDLNGDGHLDLFVCNYDAPNRLYLNRGDGSFVEQAKARGVDFSGASVMAAFADYDCDGDLDIYLVTNRIYPGPGKDVPRTEQVAGKVQIAAGGEESYEIVTAEVHGELQKYVGKSGQPDRLYRNDGSGNFELVTREAGLWHLGPGLAATWWDYDEDGLPDLYVGNDYFSSDHLYHNLGGGRFEDVTRAALPHTPWFSMGNAAADLDGDGRLDLLATDMAASSHYRSKLMMGDMADSRWFLESAEPRQYMRNALYRNTGTGRFMELAQLAGLASTDWTWSVKLGDLDLDGRIDAFFTNGSANNTFEPDLQRRVSRLRERMQRAGRPSAEVLEKQWQLYRSMPPRKERNLAFRNLGDWEFQELGEAWGLGEEVISYGAAMADLDRDGDLDLVVNHLGQPAAVYRNRSSEGNALLVRLRGRKNESNGIGARLELSLPDGSELVRYLTSASGFMSADEPMAHFGMGDAKQATSLRVLWPDGSEQRFEDLVANRLYTVNEQRDAARTLREQPTPRYTEQAAERGLPVAPVIERPFDDYARQPLLPYKLSQMGPGMAVGDADGDGWQELFIGGSSGLPGRLLRGSSEGEFEPVSGPWKADDAAEDSAILWFDADGDGDQDLLVCGGGIECAPGNALLADRLYLNLGNFAFERASDAWLSPTPSTYAQRSSTGCAVAADFDGDGHLDLYLGARSVPGAYPTTPESRLLFGTGSGFEDRTEAWAEGLRKPGMVTSALATDLDLDGRLDLLLAIDWGSLRFWHNTGSGFEEQSQQLGFSARSGWWNSLVAGDFDNDGDQDYVALGAGLNTKYHAGAAQSVRLYYADFEGQGRPNIIEAKAGAELLPVRGLSCSSGPIPSLRERVPSFEFFATASLPEIYGDGAVEQALTFDVNELSNGIWFNDLDANGNRSMRWQPLPRLAQASPGYGAVTGDFNGDGHTDLYFLQNFFGREPETGHLDGGLSMLLRGDGKGGLQPVSVEESGLSVPGDGTALVSLDLQCDGSIDFIAAENDGPLRLFVGARRAGQATLSLVGSTSNRTVLGARVTFLEGPGKGRCVEWRAGASHLSQSSNSIPFCYPSGTESARFLPMTIEVFWPDGFRSEHLLKPDTGQQIVLQSR